MGHQIIQQPDGNFVVWSTIVDDFILLDFPESELIIYTAAKAYERERETVTKIINKIKSGEKPYGMFTLTWDEANKIIDEKNNENNDQA